MVVKHQVAIVGNLGLSIARSAESQAEPCEGNQCHKSYQTTCFLEGSRHRQFPEGWYPSIHNWPFPGRRSSPDRQLNRPLPGARSNCLDRRHGP